MPECLGSGIRGHHHRGKSSEDLIDKEVVLKALNLRPGQVILDAGCGNGYMAKEFARILNGSGKVIALDPDEISIGELSRDTVGSSIMPICEDISKKTSLEALSVDLVYLSMVFHGFSGEQIDGFKIEIDRLLKPGISRENS